MRKSALTNSGQARDRITLDPLTLGWTFETYARSVSPISNSSLGMRSRAGSRASTRPMSRIKSRRAIWRTVPLTTSPMRSLYSM